MIYIIATIVLIVIVSILVWYFFLYNKKPKEPPVIEDDKNKKPDENGNGVPANGLYTTYGTPKDRLAGIPQSSTYNEITIDQNPVVETEYRLLRMAREPRPQPTFVYQSKLRDQGNPFVGDLKIKPRMNGVSKPLIAEPSDLRFGYFNQ